MGGSKHGAYATTRNSWLYHLYPNNPSSHYQYMADNSGPCWGGGHDVCMPSGCSDLKQCKGSQYCNIGHNYGETNSYGSGDYRKQFCGGYNEWTILEMEVYN